MTCKYVNPFISEKSVTGSHRCHHRGVGVSLLNSYEVWKQVVWLFDPVLRNRIFHVWSWYDFDRFHLKFLYNILKFKRNSIPHSMQLSSRVSFLVLSVALYSDNDSFDKSKNMLSFSSLILFVWVTEICLADMQHHSEGTLTHWGRDQIDAISQTTFSNVFSSMKMIEFRLKFHWSLFQGSN